MINSAEAEIIGLVATTAAAGGRRFAGIVNFTTENEKQKTTATTLAGIRTHSATRLVHLYDAGSAGGAPLLVAAYSIK